MKNGLIRWGWLSLFVLMLVACGGEVADEAAQETSQSTQPVGTPSDTPRGQLLSALEFSSELIDQPVKCYLMLPPSYSSDGAKDFPVIYWLHGSGGFPPGMLQMFGKRFQDAMQNGLIPEAIVVFPDGFVQSNWTNSKDRTLPMEDILIEELIPRIDAEYRTIPNRSGRILEGGSMGGYGAARLGLKHSTLFAGFSMLNPGPMQRVMNVEEAPIVGREGAQRIFDTVYGGDQDYFQAQSPWQLALDHGAEVSEDTKIRLILGRNNPTLKVNLAFTDHLDSLSIQHELIVLEEAGHNPREMFAALGTDYWDFFILLLAEATPQR